MRTIIAALVCALTPVAAMAQDTGWNYRASIYGWVPGLDADIGTPVGDVNTSPSGSDILDSLDFAFMGAFEAQKGKWTMLGDLLYVDLSSSKDTPLGLAYSDAWTSVKTTALSAYGLYRAYESPDISVDVGAGVRYFDVDLGLELRGNGPVLDRNFDTSKDWVVPLVAARAYVPINDKWYSTAFADFGGASSDEVTWQALVTLGYHFNETWSGAVGYRYMDINQQIGALDADLSLYGPMIGVSARF